MDETPVSQHTTQESLELVLGSELQGMKSKMLTPESQDHEVCSSNLGPYSEVMNYEELISEPQFQNVEICVIDTQNHSPQV